MKIYVTLCACFISLFSIGQISLDSALQKSFDDCINIRNNAMYFLAKYIREDRADSARQVYAIWKNKCLPDNEMIYAGAILDLMQQRKIEVSDSVEFINALIDSEFDNKYYRTQYYSYNGYNMRYEYLYIDAIADRAERILPTLKENTFDEMVCLMLGGYRADALALLKSDKMKNTAMQKQFLQRKKNMLSENGAHFQLRTGAWLPMLGASKLGINSVIGFTLGGTYGKANILELALEAKLGATPTDSVMVYYKDSLYATDYISGFYLGLEFDKTIWRSPNLRHRFGWRTGIGYDHLNVLPESLRNVQDPNPDDGTASTPRKYLPTVIANTGLTYNLRVTNVCHLGVLGKYNYTNYRNVRGTDIGGPNFSALFLISFYVNNEQEMHRLGYSF